MSCFVRVLLSSLLTLCTCWWLFRHHWRRTNSNVNKYVLKVTFSNEMSKPYEIFLKKKQVCTVCMKPWKSEVSPGPTEIFWSLLPRQVKDLGQMLGAFGQVDLLMFGWEWNARGEKRAWKGTRFIWFHHPWMGVGICQQFVSGLQLFSIYTVDWIVHKPRTSLVVDLSFFQPTHRIWNPSPTSPTAQVIICPKGFSSDSTSVPDQCGSGWGLTVLVACYCCLAALHGCCVTGDKDFNMWRRQLQRAKWQQGTVWFDLPPAMQLSSFLMTIIHHGSRCIACLNNWRFPFTGGYYPQIPGTPMKCGCHLQDSERQLVDVHCCVAWGEIWSLTCSNFNCCCPKFCWVMSGEWKCSILMIDPV